MTDFALLATVTRGGIAESHHLGDLVIADVDGQVLFAVGNPGRVAYFRSSQKPLQALAVVQSGAADRLDFTPAELSICCASHSGSAMHVATVRRILGKLGLEETALQCATHDPGDVDERNRLIRAGEAPSPLHNNCSGKHAGMLAATVALGAPVATYLERDHPLQRQIAANLAVMTGVPEGELHYGADGCGAPVIAVPLLAMATAYARLANPDDLPEDLRAAAVRIVAAMAAAPEMVASPGAFNSELLAAGEGRLVAKGGAEGVFLVGLHGPRKLALAMKFADGSGRAIAPVTMAALDAMGGLSAGASAGLDRYRRPRVTNCHGAHVGDVVASVQLEIPS